MGYLMEIALKFFLIAALLIFSALFLFSVVIFAVHHKTGGAMFVPTPKVMVSMIMDSIDFARFNDIRELGSGDGRFIYAVEKRYKRMVTGYEVNPIAFSLCWLKILFYGLDSRVIYKSFWDIDMKTADCVFCYLFPDIMPKLKERLSRDLVEGALVISANFPMPGWKPDRVLKCDHKIFNDPVYIYRIGSHLAGQH